MTVVVKNNSIKIEENILVVIAALLPILNPYSVFGVSLSIGVVFALLVYSIVKNKGAYMHRTTGMLLLFMLLVSVVDALFTSQRVNIGMAVKVWTVFFLYTLVFSYIWKKSENSDTFFEAATCVGKICAVLAILQFVFISLGYTDFYTGRLPFPMEKYSRFVPVFDVATKALRVHSFFEEPSYLATFELPVFAYLFLKKRYIWAVVIAISCFVSGSALGIIGIVFIMFFLFIVKSVPVKHKLLILFALVLVIVIGFLILSKSQPIENLVTYYLKRYSSLEKDFARVDSSVRQRTIGNLPLFINYNLFNRLFGVGVNQYSVYFNLPIDYSNDFVSMILNFGYVGLMALITWLIFLFKGLKKNRVIFLLIFILVLLVDHIWFTDIFFYLLSWVILSGNKSDVIHLTFGKNA